MKVFVAGATGVVGTRLVPLLVAAGHSVVGMARSETAADAIRATGAEPALSGSVRVASADALDRDAVLRAVCDARPDVVVHHLTAIPDPIDLRRLDRDFAATNRLRTEGTANLLAAARAAGARRLVAASFAGWTYEPSPNGTPRTEADPLLADPPAAATETLAAVRHLERAVTSADGVEGLALRFGFFYGGGTSMGPGGSVVEAVRRRRLPLIGDAAGVWSFCHAEDAALATLAAVERGTAGVYNVCDDEPAPAREWLPALAGAVGGKPPMRVPAWLARLAAGDVAVRWMTANAGFSNARAKRELGWTPRYPSWRSGFRDALAA